MVATRTQAKLRDESATRMHRAIARDSGGASRVTRARAPAYGACAELGRTPGTCNASPPPAGPLATEAPRVGHDVSKDTVARYMPKRPRRPGRPPSTTWGTFLRTHLPGTLAIDFLTVPTVTFDVLYVFFVLSLERRRILHVNVTAHPNAAWTAQQVVCD
jgi:hypothetical protein